MPGYIPDIVTDLVHPGRGLQGFICEYDRLKLAANLADLIRQGQGEFLAWLQPAGWLDGLEQLI